MKTKPTIAQPPPKRVKRTPQLIGGGTKIPGYAVDAMTKFSGIPDPKDPEKVARGPKSPRGPKHDPFGSKDPQKQSKARREALKNLKLKARAPKQHKGARLIAEIEARQAEQRSKEIVRIATQKLREKMLTKKAAHTAQFP